MNILNLTALALTLVMAQAASAQSVSIIDTPALSQPDVSGVVSWSPDPRANDCVVYVDGVRPDGNEIPVTGPHRLGTAQMTFDTSALAEGATFQVACRLDRGAEVSSALSSPVVIAAGVPETPEYVPTRLVLDDAEGGAGKWSQYGPDRSGILSASVDAGFASRVLHFRGNSSGELGGSGWEIPVNADAALVTARARTDADDHYTIVIYTATVAGARIVKWTTDPTLPTNGEEISTVLPASYNDGFIHDLALDVRAKLAADGDTLVSIDKIRVQSTSLRLDDLALTDVGTPTAIASAITLNSITGDDSITDAEAAGAITVSGSAVNLPAGERVVVVVDGTDYPAAIDATDWSVSVPTWPARETVVTASFIDADEYVIEATRTVDRYVAPTLPDGSPTAASLENTQPNGEIDTRSGVYAFPGATGFAKGSRGGRGGKVIHVTTTADNVTKGDGQVTLREAFERRGDVTPGAATVVFDVGGVFDTGQTGLTIGSSASYTTIACQTAPEPGVVISGVRIYVKGTEHFIMRHCATRFSAGASRSASESGGFRVANTGTCKHCMFDHLSVSWADDENFVFYVGGASKSAPHENIGITHSIVAEGAVVSNHEESGRFQSQARQGIPADYSNGNHSMGITCDANQNRSSAFDGQQMKGCSITANLMMNNWQRNPQMRGSVGEAVNNRIANPGARAFVSYGTDGTQRSDIVVRGNVVKEGPDSQNTLNGYYAMGAGNHSYFDNFLWKRDGTVQKYNGSNDNPRVTEQSRDGDNAFDLSCVGASKPSRDNIDQRLVTEYNGDVPGQAILASAEVGIGARQDTRAAACKASGPCFAPDRARDYSYYAGGGSRAGGFDTDDDGIPDAWETVVGLDPNDAADQSGDLDGDGYTNIEEYINGLAVCGV